MGLFRLFSSELAMQMTGCEDDAMLKGGLRFVSFVDNTGILNGRFSCKYHYFCWYNGI